MRIAPLPPRPSPDRNASRRDEGDGGSGGRGGGGDLFRPEALAEQQTRWLGTVLLAPRISHAAFTLFALLAAAGVLALLFFGEYTRKARISGWLVPDPGLVRVFAPQPGALVRLPVREGEEVAEGTPLAVLSTELRSEALGATRAEVANRLRSRRDSVLAGKERQDSLHAHQMEDLSRRLAALREEEARIEREAALQRARLALAEQAAARQRQLRERSLATEQRLQEVEEDRLDQALRMQALERVRSELDRERMRLEAERREQPLRHELRLAETDREVAALEQELAEAEAQRRIVVVAPQAGTVTAIQAEPGGRVGTAVPLLSIVPAGARLEAQLFAPSGAVGFLRPGQRVLLRYAAFPYQKFGHHAGTLASVSRSAVSPSDLPQQLSGLTRLHGGAAGEPIYRITVALESQTVSAYGRPVPLHPGMQLEADVLVETRRLVEWVLDPLFALTGRWHG
jgi:membrane fusion protein